MRGALDQPFLAVRSDDELSAVRSEVNEDPAKTEEVVRQLGTWIRSQPHLSFDASKEQLVNFLRAAKFREEKARRVIDNYVRMSCTTVARKWQLSDPQQLSPAHAQLLHSGFCVGMPKRDGQGRRVVIVQSKMWNPSQAGVEILLQIGDLCAKVLNMDSTLNYEGVVIILDYSGVNFRQMSAVMPQLKTLLDFGTNAVPLRIKGKHVINASYLTSGFVGLVKNFSGEKLRKRIHVHWRSHHSLKDHMDESVLPNEYGGTAGPIADITAQFAEHVMKNVSLLERYRFSMMYDKKKKAKK